jgi:predicted nucleotidyltransferase component of viral defense system
LHLREELLLTCLYVACQGFSVDIDLTYIPINDRETALSDISDGLGRIKADLEQSILGISVTAVSREGEDAKINCQLQKAQIKIEVNTTTRGTINDPVLLKVDKHVQESFGRFAAINVVSMAELYGGKICAALDRQHPRDLFDVKLLVENEGLTEEIKTGFLVALISHMRPINELLNSKFIDQRNAFETQFQVCQMYLLAMRNLKRLVKNLSLVLKQN